MELERHVNVSEWWQNYNFEVEYPFKLAVLLKNNLAKAI